MTIHAKLAPSAAERWINCPGSVRLVNQAGGLDSGSIYATEGTCAHEVAELEASKTLGLRSTGTFVQKANLWRSKTKRDHPEFDIDEMVDHARLYAKYLASLDHSVSALEQKVDTGIPGCYGTADATLLSPGHMYVVDYKYGRGVPVSPFWNPQEMLYGVGAIRRFEMLFPITDVTLVIYQPRTSEDPVQSWGTTAEELHQWVHAVAEPAARLALSDDGYLSPSEDACRFCPVSGTCRARMLAATRNDFGSPEMMDVDEIGQWLAKVPQIEAWCKSLRDTALDMLYRQGKPIPGWKVVMSGGRRAIKDPAAAIDKMVEAGYSLEQVSRPSARTLGDLERLVGGRKALDELLGPLVAKSEGNPSIVPADDDRPGITGATQDFSALGVDE